MQILWFTKSLKFPIKEFNTLIIHVGTKYCMSDSDVANAEQDFDAMLSNVTQRNTKIVSAVTPCADDHKDRVNKMNSNIKKIKARQPNCLVVDNNKSFKKDNKLDMGNLNRSRLHLSPKGTRKLLMNLKTRITQL